MTCTVFTPEQKPAKKATVFLAGSIENGVAVEWQNDIINKLSSTYNQFDDVELEIFNPRRANWDATIDSSSDDDELLYQIHWELERLEKSDIIIMFFDKDSKSPISLLEMGLHKDKNIFVFCPNEFWRSANVRVTCQYYGIPLYTDVDDWYNDINLNISELLTQRGW